MTPEEQAAMGAAQEKEIRDLAVQIAQLTKLGFDPMTIRKGIVAAVVDNASPPSVSINISGDTETLVTQVRTLNNFTPLAGQTVLVAKQGTEVFILGAIAATTPMGVNTTTDNGWIRATLAAGSHNGNSNGDIYYRRVLDHGSWKMQWRGGWNASGTTLVTGLDADYRPSSKRSVVAPRQAVDSLALQWDFQTDGSVTLVGPTEAPGGSAASVSHNHSATGHSHGVDFDVGHNHFGSTLGSADGINSTSHSHTVTVTVASPTWVGLNGVEYFL